MMESKSSMSIFWGMKVVIVADMLLGGFFFGAFLFIAFIVTEAIDRSNEEIYIYHAILYTILITFSLFLSYLAGNFFRGLATGIFGN